MTGEMFNLYFSHLDGVCYEAFLQQLSNAYPDDFIIFIRDNAPAHLNSQIQRPENICELALPPYTNPDKRHDKVTQWDEWDDQVLK
jgi:putative transposase